MKRFISFLPTVFLVLLAAGCATSDSPPEPRKTHVCLLTVEEIPESGQFLVHAKIHLTDNPGRISMPRLILNPGTCATLKIESPSEHREMFYASAFGSFVSGSMNSHYFMVKVTPNKIKRNLSVALFSLTNRHNSWNPLEIPRIEMNPGEPVLILQQDDSILLFKIGAETATMESIGICERMPYLHAI